MWGLGFKAWGLGLGFVGLLGKSYRSWSSYGVLIGFLKGP